MHEIVGNPDAETTSIEFRFVLDRCFAAHQAGRPDLADIYARAAEAILRLAFPEIADDIAKAASRKGQGDVIGARLVEHLDPASAACTALVLMLRGARSPAIETLKEAFNTDPIFGDTIRKLCARAFEPALTTKASETIAPTINKFPAIEVSAPSAR